MPTISRLAGRFFSVVFSLTFVVTPLLAQAGKHQLSPTPTLCQIVDTVYRADGTPAQGTALISWPAFTTAAGQAVTPGSLTVTLDASGGFNASLAPNTGASPAGTYYRAIFKLDDGTTDSEYWVVPNAQSTTIGAIRSKLVPTSTAAQFLTRDFADSTYVSLASTQTIGGIKTFSSSPAVPTPQNPTDAANKAYVDANSTGNLAAPPPIGNTTPNTGAFTSLTANNLATTSFPMIDVRAFGAVADLKWVQGAAQSQPGCTMTSGTNRLSCPNAAFTSADVGKAISVSQAGSGGPFNYLNTTIAGFTDSHDVTLAANATHTAPSGSPAYYGTDNYAAFCAATQCTTANVSGIFASATLTGRQLYIPGGAYYTSHPFYARNGYITFGGGQAATQIFLLDPVDSGDRPGTPPNVPVVCFGNATAGLDTCTADAFPSTGANGAYDLLVEAPEAANSAGFLALNTSGVYIHNVWTETPIGIGIYRSSFVRSQNHVCDVGTFQCFAIIGDGNPDGTTSTFNNTITDMQVVGASYSCGWIDGGTDLIISRMQCRDAHYRGIYFLSTEGYTARRVTLENSHFTGDTTNTIQQTTYSHVLFSSPCSDCKFIGNTFSNAPSSDIVWGSSGSGSLLIQGNIFTGGQFRTVTDSVLNTAGSSGFLNIIGNEWNNPGRYATNLNLPARLIANTVVNPFAVNTPIGGGSNPWQNGAFYFSGTSAIGDEARQNQQQSAYPAIGFAPGVYGHTSDNSALAFTGCAVCLDLSTTNAHLSWNEKTANSGSSGNAAYQSAFDPTTGQTIIPGTASLTTLTFQNIAGVEFLVSHYATIQAAINAAYNNGAVSGTVIDDRTSPYTGAGFILYDSVTLKLAATTYTITSAVTYNNGNNVVTAGIIAIPGAKLIGASTSTNHGTIITAGNGLNADLIATSTVGTGIGSAAQWWHWGGFENLRVMGNGANQTAGNCFNIENMGETAFLRTIEVSGCYLDNVLFTGASATPSDIANITTNSAGRYGFNFNNLSGVAVVHGLSGDSNTTSIIRLNGGQSGTLTILGFKTEEEISGQDPLITIDQTGQNGAQPSLYIVGGYTFGRTGVNDVIKYVNGTAGTTPYISVNNFYVQNYVNAVNDVVNGRTTAATNMNKVPFYYGPTGGFLSGQAFTLDLNTFIQSPHSGNGILTEVFGTTSSNETLIAASGTSTSISVGGIGFRMPNRTTYGQSPDLFAKMTYAFPGGIPNTQQWEFIPVKVSGDNSTRWLGDPSYRWDELYSTDVNTTTATVGTLNVTTCNGCGTGTRLVTGTMQGATSSLTGNSADQTLYTATLPAGTFAVGGGVHCYAKWTHLTASGAITYKWTLGTTTWAYGSYTSASQNLAADLEILTISSLSSQSVNLSPVIAGTAIGIGGSYGNTGAENLANSDTIKLTFNAGSSDQVKGATFYCQTVQ